MIELIASLVEKGYAYESDGSVFFSIARDPDYGRLSGFDLGQVRQGERVASDEYDKEDVRDFVLWKAVKPGEPSWDSPWGPGRPGLARRVLGHEHEVPGRDLRPPLRRRGPDLPAPRERDRPERVARPASPSSTPGCTPST